MNTPFAAVALALVLTASCTSSGSEASTGSEEPTAELTVDALRAEISAFQAKPEHTEEAVRVEHILVGIAGAPRMNTNRSKAEAEELVVEILNRYRGGEDFSALRQQFSEDTGGGVYGMTMGAPKGDAIPRSGMVPAFGDVGWRLAVGEVGVAPHDAQASPYGYHIVKRVE